MSYSHMHWLKKYIHGLHQNFHFFQVLNSSGRPRPNCLFDDILILPSDNES